MKKNRIIIYLILVFILAAFNFYYRPISGNKLVTKDYKKSKAYVNNLYKSDEFFKENLLNPEEYSVYELMMEDIKNGIDRTNVTCKNGCDDAFLNAYYAIYLDHPELIAFQGASAYGSETSLSIHYHSLGKVQAYFGTRRIERELDIIKRETKNMDDQEKIFYVYNYVAGHNYDKLFTYSDSNQSAYSFFTKGTSVCAGFAKASQLIFQNIGISSYLVMNNDHMWNYVKYKGNYYVFDATVGASYMNKTHPNFYDGLGRTTVGENTGLFPSLYPKIEEKPLKEIFELE